MIRKIFLILIFFTVVIKPQAEYVEITNRVYSFLERVETLHLITNYDEFEIPKTRKIIGNYLKEVSQSKEMLTDSDIQELNDLLIEFDLEVTDTTANSVNIFQKGYNFFSDQSKYLYFNTGKSGSLFISLLTDGEIIVADTLGMGSISSAYLLQMGGQIRGTLLNKFGFSIKGTNGKGFGDKPTALLKKELQYNFKFNENDDNFFDNTEGYLTADFDQVRFKIGRDRMNIGPGILKPILNSNSPAFDYLYLNISLDIVHFSFFHGKLLGEETVIPDSIAGPSTEYGEKYLGYHRIGFDFSRHLTLGAGELIIYGDRPVEFSYLNPFNFYKTIEHSGGDRDNAMVFIDAANNSFKNVKFYGLLFIDDISFSKINTGWWGNQVLLNAGTAIYNMGNLPADLRLEYLRIEPYTHTHRLNRNSYTSKGYSLSSMAEPNSETFFAGLNYRFTGRLLAGMEFLYYVHGANPLNEDGTLRENVGGDIQLGHRTTDADYAGFLNGDPEYTRSLTLTAAYEPFNQFIFTLRFSYISEALQNRLSQEKLESFINLSIRI